MPESLLDVKPSKGKNISVEVNSVEILLSVSVIPMAVFWTSWSMAFVLWYPSKGFSSKTTN